MTEILLKIITVLLSILPTSVILIKLANKYISKDDESLAKIGTICTEVLGTLTKRELEVCTLYFNNYHAEISAVSTLLDLEDHDSKEKKQVEKVWLKQDESVQFSAIVSTLCHYPKISHFEAITNNFFRQCTFQKSMIESEYATIQKIPSDNEKKISTIIAQKNSTKEIYAFSKGNPQKLLARCKRIFIDGKKIDLDKSQRAKVLNRIKKLNKKGQKVIAFAYKGLPIKRFEHYSSQFAENDLIFLGFMGYGNVLNTEIKEQIETIKKLGIKIYILAKTKEKRSVAAGLELGIINPHYFESFTSADLNDLNDEKLNKMLSNKEKDYIFTELTGEDKNRILKTLQKLNQNLKIVSATDPEHFKKLVKQIEISRIHKENRQKIVKHNLGAKIPESILAGISLVLGMPPVFSIPLILFIDLTINMPLQFAIQSEKPDINVMSNKYLEESKKNRIPFSKSISTITIIIVGLSLFNIYRGGWAPGEILSTQATFIAEAAMSGFIALTILQLINAWRMSKKVKENHYLLAVSVIIILIIYAILNLSSFQKFLGLKTITSFDWQIISFLIIVFLFIIEIWPRLKSKFRTISASK